MRTLVWILLPDAGVTSVAPDIEPFLGMSFRF